MFAFRTFVNLISFGKIKFSIFHYVSGFMSSKTCFSDLSGNGLAMCVEDESALANTSLPTLQTLRFASNRVRTIPARAFENFPSLQILDLTDNPIASVQNGAFESLNLRRL